MPESRSGVLAAGHFIVDHVKIVNYWPEQDALATIVDEKRGNGGCAFNCLMDLAKLGAAFPLSAAGLVGQDQDGEWVREQCRLAEVDATALLAVPELPTSYTLVMSASDTGRRTFFHRRGATIRFNGKHVPLQTTRAKILHVGYVGLLDAFEFQAGNHHGYAELLAQARKVGMITSVDLVSNPGADLQGLLAPALPEIDWLFGNESEIARAAGVPSPGPTSCERFASSMKAGQKLIKAGVRRAVIVHFPQGAVAITPKGHYLQGSVKMPPKRIRGTAGAGDAFSAGALIGLNANWAMPAVLELACCIAAASLEDETCSAAIKPWQECLTLGRRLGFTETVSVV